MAAGQWMKIVGTVTTLAQVGAQFLRPPATDVSQAGAGSLEHRLAGVVVAALKEAFDRDRTRMDLERETIEAERSRAERALQAELRRQAADRALMQIKLISIFAGLVLLMSSVLAAWIGGMRLGTSAVLLTIGWAMALGTLGCVFAAWQQVAVWASATEPPPAGSSSLVATAPWLLLVSLVFVAGSLLLAG
ncbi:MAG TPA: hypothetical protein VJ813_18715 [Vicinamibacterales bacterium]|nr:hypothetical protein [Vicinamibacterales bacterium]